MNNIIIIREFLKSSDNRKLIINEVSEEISVFYRCVIEHYCKEMKIKFLQKEKAETYEAEDLFFDDKIYFFSSTNKKSVENILKGNTKIVIFSDYKIFKYYNDLISVNGYKYQEDIKFYLQKYLKIENLKLLEFCLSTPQLAFSEISKFITNSDGYIKETKINEKDNHIIQLRKELNNLKRHGVSIKEIYSILKKEVKYKKFNFLTY